MVMAAGVGSLCGSEDSGVMNGDVPSGVDPSGAKGSAQSTTVGHRPALTTAGHNTDWELERVAAGNSKHCQHWPHYPHRSELVEWQPPICTQ